MTDNSDALRRFKRGRKIKRRRKSSAFQTDKSVEGSPDNVLYHTLTGAIIADLLKGHKDE